MTIEKLYNLKELIVVERGLYGSRKYSYMGVISPWLDSKYDLKKWLETFLIEFSNACSE